MREFFIRGNKCIGSGSGAGAYDIGLNHALRGLVIENTFMSPGPYAQRGRIAVDNANCRDVSVDTPSNVYIPKIAAALPIADRRLPSAAALPVRRLQ